MMLNFVDSIGTFDHPVLQLLVVLGIGAIGDGVRLARAAASTPTRAAAR
jgi:hypothetical protein